MSFAWHEVRDHLLHSASTLGFQRSFDTIRSAQVCLAAFRDPAALLDLLHRGPGDAGSKNVILSALIEAAQDDSSRSDCAVTLLLLALWPGLDAIRRRSIWRKLGLADEVASGILGRTTEAIRGLDLRRVNWIAATVLRNVERDMIRSSRRETDRQSFFSDVDPHEIADDRDALDPMLDHDRLRREVCRLIGEDAALVFRVAVEGFSQSEVAIELGLSESATRKRYQRATRRLRAALPEYV